MKTFFCLICLWFCQNAFGAVSVKTKDFFSGRQASCTLSDATIVKTQTGSTQTFTFTHSIQFNSELTAAEPAKPDCVVQLSRSTQTSGLSGGWKFQAASLDDIAFSFVGGCTAFSFTGSSTPLNTTLGNAGRNSLSLHLINPSLGSCSFSYSIVLVADTNSSSGSAVLTPLIDFGIRDAHDRGAPDTLLSQNLGSVTPNPSPRSTCNLTVPSNVNLGSAKPSDFPSIKTSFVNPTSFPIRVNCAQKLPATFTPNLTLTYTSPSTLGCFAQNALTTGSPTNALVKIYSTNASNQKVEFCQQGNANPTTLAFPTSVANVLYDQTVILIAAFERIGSAITTGAFTTSATFTVTYN